MSWSADTRLSPHYCLRDLVECGETFHALAREPETRLANLPVEADSVAALAGLATLVLEPVLAEFGSLTLTYGLASPALSRAVQREVGRVAPSLDQHAAHERSATGRMVCSRGGAAVDLLVAGVPATVVARFVATQTPFDRLYLYGEDRPVHVSWGAANDGTVVRVERRGDGVVVPRRVPVRRL